MKIINWTSFIKFALNFFLTLIILSVQNINAAGLKGSLITPVEPPIVIVPDTPDMPRYVTVPTSDTDGNFSISWSMGSGSQNLGAIFFLQQQRNGGSYATIYQGSASSKSLSGLSNGSYKYRVRACNDNLPMGCSGYAYSTQVTVSISTSPTISNIGNKTINEDSNTGNIAFTVSDSQTAAGSLTVTRSSSNTALVPTANIVLGGSGGSRTVKVTPLANKSGSVTITVTVSDGSLTKSDSFVVTVNAVNDRPTISNIGNKTINEDSNTGFIGFTVSDVETSAGSLTVTRSSSNTALVPTANIVLGGSGGSRTVKVTPLANKSGSATITVTVSDGSLTKSDTFIVTVNAVNDAPTISNIGNKTINEDSNTGSITFTVGDQETSAGSLTLTRSSSNTSLVPTANIALGGSGASRKVKVTPVANKSGAATITVTVSDGSLTKSDTFVVTVNAVNDRPTISNIGNKTINEDSNTGSITFTVGDQETSAGSLTLTRSSSNTSLVPAANISLGGSGATRKVKVIPVANKSGSATITITVSDGALTKSSSFILTVNAVNDAPIADNDSASTSEDTAVNINVLNGDNDIEGSSLTPVVYNSPSHGSLTVNTDKTIRYAPNNNFNGTDSFKYRAKDSNGAYSNVATVTITVTAVNDRPTISNISDKTVEFNTSTGGVPFTIGDVETSAGSLFVTAVSNNAALIPNGNLIVEGSASNRTISATPVTGQSGSAMITVTVSDGELTKSDNFILTVNEFDIELSIPDATPTTLTRPTNEIIGEIPGSASVNGGTASYQIPIMVPPGRLNMAPSLSLNYSSSAGNGLVGKGWGVSGLSSIRRCSANRTEDGYVRNVNIDVLDQFCLNGQKLKKDPVFSLGLNNTQYRTVRDQFSKITYKDPSATIFNPITINSHFEVKTKDGLTQYFGINPSSSKPLFWLLDKVEDQHGNTIEYEYYDQDDEIYITDIYYTGKDAVRGNRRVSFSYESRPDVTKTYNSASFGTTDFAALRNKRLRSITSFVGNTQVYNYELDYDISPVTGNSRLTSVELCATADNGQQQCLPKREISWSGDVQTYDRKEDTIDFFDDIEYWNAEKQQIVDINKDGILDFIVFNKYFPGIFENNEYSLDSANAVILPFDNIDQDNVNLQGSIDFNADGQVDLIGVKNGNLQIAFLNSTQTGFTTQNLGIPLNCGESRAFNPNAEPYSYGQTYNIPNNCSVTVVPDGTGGNFIYYRSAFGPINMVRNAASCGNEQLCAPQEIISLSQEPSLTSGTEYQLADVGPFQVFDYNGDGNVDFVFVTKNNQLRIYLQTRGYNYDNISFSRVIQNFTLSGSRSAALDGGYRWIDVNGDGLKDFMAIQYVGEHEGSLDRYWYDHEWFIAPNTGGALGEFSPMGITEKHVPRFAGSVFGFSLTQFTTNQFIRTLDYDGDGKEDVMMPSPAGVSYRPCTLVVCINGNNEDPFLQYSVAGVSTANWIVYKSSTEANGDYSSTKIITGINGTLSYFFPIDLNHDGTMDFLTAANLEDSGHRSSEPHKVITYIGKHHEDDTDFTIAADLMLSISDEAGNNMGRDVEFIYKPYSHTMDGYSVTSLDLEENYFRIPTTKNVVTSILRDNGVGGKNRVDYSYGTPIYNTRGLGFVGFESIEMKDIASGITQQNFFEYRFPLSGKILTAETFQTSNNRLLKSGSFTYCNRGTVPINDCAGVFEGVYVPLVTRSVSDTYDVRGNHIKTVTTSLDSFDSVYGNIQQTTTVNEDSSTTLSVTKNSYYLEADEIDWWVNKLDYSKTNSSVSYSNNQGIVNGTNSTKWSKQIFEWKDNDFRELNSINITGSDTQLESISTFNTYDDYGNPTRITQTGQADPTSSYSDVENSLISRMDFDETNGYFPVTEHNGVWDEAVVTRIWDERYGQVISVMDINGISITNIFDAFGRVVQSSSDLVPTSDLITQWCDFNCTTNAVFKITTVQDGSPTTTVEKDNQGRTLKATVENFSANIAGEAVTVTNFEYDALGRLLSERLPHFEGATGGTITYNAYDVLGRYGNKVTNNSPQVFSVNYQYNGLETTITVNAGGDGQRTMRRKYNSLSKLMSTMDADGNYSYFRYDAFGNPILIKDVSGNIISAMYDGLGNKNWFDDPSMGKWNFHYNGLGQLRWQQDANTDETRFSYDGLGRQVKRYINNISDTTLVFDTRKKGLLSSQSRQGLVNNYYYDELARVTTQQSSFQGLMGQSFDVDFAYDNYYGRVKGMQYPSGETVAYKYDEYGYSTQDVDPLNGNSVYRQIHSISNLGKIQKQSYGNGLHSLMDYAQSGETYRVCVSGGTNCSLTKVDEIAYTNYDNFGNLREQQDYLNNIQESFVYDNLHRLTQSSRSYSGNAIPLLTPAVIDYDYDASGNLIQKSDYANTYNYAGSGGPNAVASITKLDNTVVTFGYDDNGNMTTGDSLSINYNSFNKPETIIRNSVTSTFSYGADQKRFKQVVQKSGAMVTTYYVDKLYERITTDDGNTITTEEKSYLGNYAVVSKKDNVRKVHYLHRDRLGSVSLISDGNRTTDDVFSALDLVVERKGFDAFGKARDAFWGDSNGGLLLSNVTTRGFTDHEHLDGVELIHMNGRAYDYNLGRFLSVDPFITLPENSQAINSYSYIMNNPLAGTDPSGYSIRGARTGPYSVVNFTSDSSGSGGTPASAGSQKVPTSSSAQTLKVGDIGTETLVEDNSDIYEAPVSLIGDNATIFYKDGSIDTFCVECNDSSNDSFARSASSFVMDVLPIVGAAKSLIQFGLGYDIVTGEPIDRLEEGIGIFLGLIPGGKFLSKLDEVSDLGQGALRTLRRESSEAGNGIPDKIFRQGRSNDSAIKDIRVDADGASFRDSLSNPLPSDGAVVMKPGKPFIAVDTSLLPKGSVIVDNIPPGHVSVKATAEEIVNAIDKASSGKFPKN